MKGSRSWGEPRKSHGQRDISAEALRGRAGSSAELTGGRDGWKSKIRVSKSGSQTEVGLEP